MFSVLTAWRQLESALSRASQLQARLKQIHSGLERYLASSIIACWEFLRRRQKNLLPGAGFRIQCPRQKIMKQYA